MNLSDIFFTILGNMLADHFVRVWYITLSVVTWINFGVSFWRNVRQWRRHQKNQKSRSDTETEEILGSPKQSTEEMDILDNTECKFNVNSFKIVYVVNSEYYLYKRTALTKAREVGVCGNGEGVSLNCGGRGEWVGMNIAVFGIILLNCCRNIKDL